MEIKKLGTICKLKQGFQVPLSEQETEKKEGYVRFIRIVDYTQNTNDIRYVIDNEKYYYVKPDDVVMVRYGAAGEVGHGISGVIANNMFLIEPTIDINKNYLFYFLSQKNVKNKLLSTSTSTTMPALNFKIVNDLDIPIWDRIKQNKIVEVFDELSKIIADRTKEISLLDELIKARFVEMFGDPVSNPLGWKKKMLKTVCVKLNDGTHFSPESFEEGEYKYVTAKNIKESGFDFTNITYVSEAVHRPIYERCNPELGDVLYIKDGVTTGIAMVNTINEEFTLLSSVALLKQNRKIMDGYFLAAVLNNENMYSDIRSNMGGAAITRLTIAKLNMIQIIVPPLKLQQQFADFVHQVDKSKVAVQKALDETQLLFDSLMQQYFG